MELEIEWFIIVKPDSVIIVKKIEMIFFCLVTVYK